MHQLGPMDPLTPGGPGSTYDESTLIYSNFLSFLRYRGVFYEGRPVETVNDTGSNGSREWSGRDKPHLYPSYSVRSVRRPSRSSLCLGPSHHSPNVGGPKVWCRNGSGLVTIPVNLQPRVTVELISPWDSTVLSSVHGIVPPLLVLLL